MLPALSALRFPRRSGNLLGYKALRKNPSAEMAVRSWYLTRPSASTRDRESRRRQPDVARTSAPTPSGAGGSVGDDRSFQDALAMLYSKVGGNTNRNRINGGGERGC